ncbi:TPA: hypothetical protein IUU33_003278, partial [Enterococcus faecalis]|nr:hypothetical protein [Enterococcus faecalis]
MRMLQSIPALPVGDIKKSIGFYCDKLGFTLVHHEDGFAVLMCNEVRIHLWGVPSGKCGFTTLR